MAKQTSPLSFIQAQFVYFHPNPSYRASARPRTPAAPAKLIARPPVAAGAPPVEEEVPEPDAEVEEEPLLVADLVWVAVEVKVRGVEAVVELGLVERGVEEE